MAGTRKESEFVLHIHPALLHNAEHFSALHGQTTKKWITEAIIAKLEDEIDIAAAEESMADTEGTVSLEEYLESRKLRRPQE